VWDYGADVDEAIIVKQRRPNLTPEDRYRYQQTRRDIA
jgi:hypothetical protein